MRREQDAGGIMPAVRAVEFCRNLLDRLETEAGGEPGERAARSARLGKLAVGRTRPRRLDARIVRRRPMMLVKRRPWGPVPQRRLAGREIIARS